MSTSIFFNGSPVPFSEGESVAAALLRNGENRIRDTRFNGESRTLFCGIGICFDCIVHIDGIPNQRACIVECRDGMKIESGS
jgi:predicted molibdopterin-dependent oxidoreductase YjgC